LVLRVLRSTAGCPIPAIGFNIPFLRLLFPSFAETREETYAKEVGVSGNSPEQVPVTHDVSTLIYGSAAREISEFEDRACSPERRGGCLVFDFEPG
jgi:hypothetical protein